MSGAGAFPAGGAGAGEEEEPSTPKTEEAGGAAAEDGEEVEQPAPPRGQGIEELRRGGAQPPVEEAAAAASCSGRRDWPEPCGVDGECGFCHKPIDLQQLDLHEELCQVAADAEMARAQVAAGGYTGNIVEACEWRRARKKRRAPAELTRTSPPRLRPRDASGYAESSRAAGAVESPACVAGAEPSRAAGAVESPACAAEAESSRAAAERGPSTCPQPAGACPLSHNPAIQHDIAEAPHPVLGIKVCLPCYNSYNDDTANKRFTQSRDDENNLIDNFCRVCGHGKKEDVEDFLLACDSPDCPWCICPSCEEAFFEREHLRAAEYLCPLRRALLLEKAGENEEEKRRLAGEWDWASSKTPLRVALGRDGWLQTVEEGTREGDEAGAGRDDEEATYGPGAVASKHARVSAVARREGKGKGKAPRPGKRTAQACARVVGDSEAALEEAMQEEEEEEQPLLSRWLRLAADWVKNTQKDEKIDVSDIVILDPSERRDSEVFLRACGGAIFLWENVAKKDRRYCTIFREASEQFGGAKILLLSSHDCSDASRLRQYATNLQGQLANKEWSALAVRGRLGVRNFLIAKGHTIFPAWFVHSYESKCSSEEDRRNTTWLTIATKEISDNETMRRINDWFQEQAPRGEGGQLGDGEGPTLDEEGAALPKKHGGERIRKIVRAYSLIPDKKTGLPTVLPSTYIEALHGLPDGHTQIEPSASKRRTMLGDGMMTWHLFRLLAPLRTRQLLGELPESITVLSLFDGIGTVAVALEQLGVKVRFYIVSELSYHSRRVAKAFLESRKPGSSLYGCEYIPLFTASDNHDISQLKKEQLDKYIEDGGIHLVVGGTPCTNMPSTSNRVSPHLVNGSSGFAGRESRHFYKMVVLYRYVNGQMQQRYQQGKAPGKAPSEWMEWAEAEAQLAARGQERWRDPPVWWEANDAEAKIAKRRVEELGLLRPQLPPPGGR